MHTRHIYILRLHRHLPPIRVQQNVIMTYMLIGMKQPKSPDFENMSRL